MGLLDFLKPANINTGVEEFRATPGAQSTGGRRT